MLQHQLSIQLHMPKLAVDEEADMGASMLLPNKVEEDMAAVATAVVGNETRKARQKLEARKMKTTIVPKKRKKIALKKKLTRTLKIFNSSSKLPVLMAMLTSTWQLSLMNNLVDVDYYAKSTKNRTKLLPKTRFYSKTYLGSSKNI